MNSNSQKASTHKSNSGAGHETAESSAEATLRLIARLPAPKNLEDRVMAGLTTAPRRGRVLNWPSMLHPTGSWVRGAAAAAIVFVVTGGGWGIYTRVQPSQTTKVIVIPRAGAGGGFSSAGAMRTPQTVNGAIVAAPVKVPTANATGFEVQPAEVKPQRVEPARVVPMKRSQARRTVNNKTSAQPVVLVAK